MLIICNLVSQNNSIECCDDDGISYSTKYMHPSCASITIPEDDQFFSQIGRTCMNYVRSIPAMRSDCTFGPREQVIFNKIIYLYNIYQLITINCILISDY